HPYPVYLMRPIERRIERGQLVDRAQQEFVPLLEPPHSFHELAVHDHRAREPGAGYGQAGFDFGNRLGLELIPVGLEQRSMKGRGSPRTNREKHFIGARQIRACVVDTATEILEDPARLLENRPDPTTEREPAAVRTPR